MPGTLATHPAPSPGGVRGTAWLPLRLSVRKQSIANAARQTLNKARGRGTETNRPGSAAGGGETQPPCPRESWHGGEGGGAAPSRLRPRASLERGWRMSSALPRCAGEQQHLSRGNAAACCFCLSLGSRSRGFRKQPRLEHLPTSAEEQKNPTGQLQAQAGPLWLGPPFPFEGVQLVCGASGPRAL